MEKIIAPLLLSLGLVSSGTSAIAVHGNNDKQNNKDKARFELIINDKNGPKNQKLEINNQTFEATGKIDSISNNTFVVLGQTITVDLTQIAAFKQKGILKVGETVKVEGVVKNGVYLAQEIKVVGTGQGRFKFEVKGIKTTLTPTPTGPTGTPSITPTTTVTPTLTITPSATPSISLNQEAEVKIKANGPLGEIIAFLEQVLSSLGKFI